MLFVVNDALSALLKTLCFCSDGWETTRVSFNSYPRNPIAQPQNKAQQSRTKHNKAEQTFYVPFFSKMFIHRCSWIGDCSQPSDTETLNFVTLL